ncbi:hypothetical protein CBR_g358 [Chara braunii]|uniref:Uncharacterized protein n=1 Tax=Chara braunii TaxID=69332 RepID=A0A388JQH1_CHABU|nr:hypothetical protein CBR_g358 [Chara braunii]|eukprot:GBG60027.1 hypothetical protein CBR_g358 [Chara braunii]
MVRRRQGARPSDGPASPRRRTIEASVTSAADAAHPTVAAAAAVGVAAVAAAAGAPAGSLCWCSCCAPVFPPMVRRRQGARPSDGPASSRRRTIEASGTAVADAVVPTAVATVAGAVVPTVAVTSKGWSRWHSCCAPVFPPMVRRRQGAIPSDGSASSRRWTIEASVTAVVDVAHPTVSAAAAVGVAVIAATAASSRRRTMEASDTAGADAALPTAIAAAAGAVVLTVAVTYACSSGVSTPKVVGRAVTFQEKYWAIDWHLGMKIPCCGPVIFLRNESSGYYPCGGIKTYSFDKSMLDEEYMRFHLTTCFNIDGHEVPDNYKLMSLHVEKFQGYSIRAASMSPFDKSKKKDASQIVMLRSFEFLKRVNCYKVSNHIVTIDNNLQLSTPFVPFDCDLGDFADMAVGKSCGEPKTSARMSKSEVASTQAKSVSKSASLLRPKGVSATRAPSHAEYAARVSLTPAGTGHEDDDENTEEDSRFRQWDGGQWADGNDVKDTEGDDAEQRFRDGAHDEEGSLEDDLAEDDGSEGQEDGGHKDDGSEEEENEDASDEDATKREDNYEGGSEGDEGGADDDDGGNRGSQKRQEQSSHATSHDGPSEDDDVLHGTQRSVCMRKWKMRCEKAEKEKWRQAKLISLQASKEAYNKSLEAQSAKPTKEKRVRTRSSQRPKKKAKAEEKKEVADSGDKAAGVDPRHTASKPRELTNDTIDTTRCFFLEYDEDGNVIDRPTQVFVDVVKILSNPSEGVQYNHRPLNEMFVTSIRDVMEHPEKQKECDRNTWILAPVAEVQKDDRKQWECVKPEEWDDDKVASYHWYTVADQYTAEAAKSLIDAKSSADHKWGVHYWKARVVYFDDDHLEGYAYISTFDNTRETRAIPSSFQMVNQSLAKRFVRNWSSLLRSYMCLAASSRVVWNLVEKFFDKWEKGELSWQDGVRPVDQEGKAGEAAGPSPAAKTVKGKKVLVHYVQSNKSSSGFYVCINDPFASAWKVFDDFTSREKEMTLEKILAEHVVVTSGRTFVKKLMNMQDLYVEVRRERYMIRMFNYILFKIEQRSKEELNDKFFFGYDTIMRLFALRGLTTEKWEETKSKIVAEKTINVPK